jgi:hypothetical protein
MAVSTISTTITTQVTPGVGNYAAALDITQTGALTRGIYVETLVSGVSIVNRGAVYGVDANSLTTLTNYGTVGTPVDSINLHDGGVVNNFGVIGAAGVSSSGVSLNQATLNNHGTLSQAKVGAVSYGAGDINNAGFITGAVAGVILVETSTLENSGTISSTETAVTLQEDNNTISNSGLIIGDIGIYGGGPITNTGTIDGATDGIKFVTAGTLTNAGTIVGANDAIYAASTFTLIVDPGAVFAGGVADSTGTGSLQLGGSLTSISGLNMGGSFSGFETIQFDTGARWSLEGSIGELAAGQTINGFAANDTLILDGFIASSSSIVAGTGLVLSNGFSTETLDIKGSFHAGDYTLTSTGSGTEIQHTKHVIDTTVFQSVTIGGGVYLSPLTVAASGRVVGDYYGVLSQTGGTLVNQGYIAGGGNNGGFAGVLFGDGGTVINSGEIRGSDGFEQGGLGISLRDALLINTGTILGGANGNLHFTHGAVYAYQSTVENFGVILGGGNLGPTGGGEGVDQIRGTFFNAGTIIGGTGTYSRYNSGPIGVGFSGSGTLINAGTIIGGTNSPTEQPQAVDVTTLVIETGASFIGSVYGTTLAFAAGSSGNSGSLDMGGTFVGFSSIDFDAGAQWKLAGNTGELANRQTINGFTAGDTLVLEGFTATSETYLIGAGLKLSNGTITETLGITGNFSTSSFHIFDTTQGTEIVVCYLRGTRILTPHGERPVETLTIGDAVVTRFGGTRKVKWIGRQSFGPRFIASNFDRIPVRIKAGALGAKLPVRDLFVSPGHSMLLGNRLVLANCLVNGITITQDLSDSDVHYHQIEFESHDCVRAEGAWSESFADGPGLRNQFHNVREFYSLYPAHPIPETLSLCAPRPERGLELAAALRPVVARAGRGANLGMLRGSIDLVGDMIEGWAQDLANPRLPVLLEIVARGRTIGEALACDYREDLAAAGIGAGRAHFAFRPRVPVAAESLRIRRKTDGAEIFVSEDCRRRA